jgi:hypothetical protein
MDPYHYVNLPKDANAYDQQRGCKLRNCIIEAIAWYVQVLKSPLTGSTPGDTRCAICYVDTSPVPL